MALGSRAKRALVWTASALAGAGLLAGSFFAGAAVAGDGDLEQAGSTSQQEDTRDYDGHRDGRELSERDGDAREDAENPDTQDEGTENGDAGDREGDGREQRRHGPEDRDDHGRGEHRDGRHGGDGDAPEGNDAGGGADNDQS